MKKILILFTVLLVSTSIFSACKKGGQNPSPAPSAKPRKTDKNVNQEPIENRPYVVLTPRDDGHAIHLVIKEVKKKASDLEYEVEYSSGSLLQGAFGSIPDLSSLPIKKEILLGSCSTGGKCTYNPNVTGGTLSLRFGNPDYTLKQEWSFTEKASTKQTWASRDGKFTVDTGTGKNAASTVVIYNSPGFAGTVTGSVIAGPYTVALSGNVQTPVTVSLRLPTDAQTGMLIGYDGTTWKELPSTLKDRVVTSKGLLLESYALISK